MPEYDDPCDQMLPPPKPKEILGLHERLTHLVDGVDVDLDMPLSPDDE